MNKESARKKAKELIAKMSTEEKVSQLLYEAPAIPRLGIGEYNWWNEALHGVARAGRAAVFPQAIGLGASFDPLMVRQVGSMVGQEGRIKNEIYRSEGRRGIYQGLTFWSPNINIVRDPRWGRAHEAYGEDPFLTSAIGTAFVRGVQGEDPEHLQAAACAKHFAVHSGPEATRHGFNAEVSEQDLRQTYLPAFEHLVKDADVAGVMSAYNAVNGVPSSCSSYLLRDILRGEWGFDGYTVSDCGAVHDIFERHHFTDTKVEAAGRAVSAGCNLNCGSMYGYLLEALQKGFVTEEAIDEALENLWTVRFRLDMEGDADGAQAVDRWLRLSPELYRLEEQAAEESLVLLKNDGILPLKNPERIAVIGPNARSVSVLEGNYHGTSDHYVTLLEGIRAEFAGSQVLGADGCHLYKAQIEAMSHVPDDQLGEALALARACDVTVLCLGLDPSIEGELGDASNEYGAGDKPSLLLPESQRRLLHAVLDASDRVIVVLLSGGAIDLQEDDERISALVQAWYPGALGGKAVAGLLSGRVNPTGRLPVTFYHNHQVSWDFEDYSMKGKTYRYFEGRPRYPFGFGLSYRYLQLSEARMEDGCVHVLACNPHSAAVAMPLQIYVSWSNPSLAAPLRQLAGVTMIRLQAGEQKEIRIPIDSYWLSLVDEKGHRVPHEGEILFTIGDHQPDERSCELSHEPLLRLSFKAD